VPERIVFVEALPKTSVGKLDKKVLRERYAQ
jgi:fatty-acyl-CoA synthase